MTEKIEVWKPKDPRRLSDRHRAMLRRLAAGQSVVGVAQSMGVSAAHISRVRNSPLGRQFMADLQRRLDDALIQGHVTASLARRFPELLGAGK